MTKIFVIAERILSLMTDKITALTDRERDEHLEQGIAAIEKYVIIHSGVMLQQIMNMNFVAETGKKKLCIPQNSNVIGVVGRLVPIKGHKYLVSAAKRIIREFNNTVFVFVGDGYLESKLERQSESLGVRKNIIFTGWRKDVTEILSLFDILVLPSLNEGMGKVLIEGMALGKPIVASSVGGIIDLVKNGDNGILVPPKDSDALEEAILKLIRNKNLAQKLGKNGKARVYPEYDTFVMVRQIEDLYEDLLSKLAPSWHQFM
jgi:glycosyltransferase involved in cell wall biosynthesis